MQRIGPLALLPDILGELGLSLDDALDGTGVRRDDLTAEARVPFSAALRLLERTATLSGCPHLGLLVGARSDHRVLGLVGTMMSHAQTLGDALRDYVAGSSAIRVGPPSTCSPWARTTSSATDCMTAPRPARSSSMTSALRPAAISCGASRAAEHGPRVSCSRGARRRKPPPLLKIPVAFDQEQSGIVISAADRTSPCRARTRPSTRASSPGFAS